MQCTHPRKSLRVLILEDIPTDAELMEQELRSAGIEFVSTRVDNRDSFQQALLNFRPEMILSDYSLPSFDGEAALLMAQETTPGVPFVFVTGAVGEERAVELLKSGATDFVLKDRLFRLPLCVQRALEEVEEKRRRRRAEEDLHRAHADLERKVEELRHHTTMLEQSNRDLEEFAYVASHDLQEPVRKIQTFADLLETTCKGGIDDKACDYLKRLRRSAGRIQELVLDLLRYSSVTSRTEPFTLFNLSEPVGEAVTDLGPLLDEAGGQIEIGALPDVAAVKVQMRQLFQNLISNGLKYRGEDKPVVKVYNRSTVSDPFWEIHIQDNGIGFDERYLDKIFKPFQRLHGKNSPYSGAGIGLAICRRIVERHGGSITARSKPGEGATFIVRLPRKQQKTEL